MSGGGLLPGAWEIIHTHNLPAITKKCFEVGVTWNVGKVRLAIIAGGWPQIGYHNPFPASGQGSGNIYKKATG